jgi:GMP synthase (glutamine-hydrolysing)
MKKQRIHHIQHVPFEGIGNISDWILQNNLIHTETHLYKNEPLPDLNNIDILVIMGGPMSTNDDDEITWLQEEKEFIKKAIKQHKTVIGFCLGAQLIANVLGASVYKNSQKEIGFFSIQKNISQNDDVQSIVEKIANLLNNKTVFHWHGETFDLPIDAVRLVSSKACLNQAFLYKENVLGLQFHVEMNKTSIHNIIENCRAELTVSDFIQSEEMIKKEMKNYIDENKNLLFELLDSFI